MQQQKKSLLFPVLLVFYEITTYLSNDMYLPALPNMMRDLGFTMQQAQLTLTMWFLGGACTPLLMGVVVDRFGRRSVLLIGGLIYIAASITCALSTHFYILIAARIIQGGMVASMLVPGYACIHELYEQREAIRILALMGSIVVLAPAFGPLLGGIVLTIMGWRWIFGIIAICATLAVSLLYKHMPETYPVEKRQPIHFGRLLKQYGGMLVNKQFLQLSCVLGFVFAGFIVWITAGPLLVIESFHYSAITFGMMQVAIFIAFIVGNRLVKYLLEWIGIRYLIHLGLVITLCGGLGILATALQSKHIYPFLSAMAIYALGSGLCFAPLNRSIIEASDEAMGVRVALATVLFTGFGALGSALASQFFNGSMISLAYLISIASIVACIVKVGSN